jgi:hypothetical protein
MRSSDQRYYHVRRTKREVNLYPEVDAAFTAARRDSSAIPELDHLIERSAREFSHVLLACGRTANDFRRSFRRGCARHNIIKASEIAPYEALLPEKLDGFVCLRLSKEQSWNVKERWGKLQPQDCLVHDPQGVIWTRLAHGSIAGPDPERLGILTDLQDRCIRFGEIDTVEGLAHVVVKLLQRQLRSLANKTSEHHPELTDTGYRNLAMEKFVAIRKLLTYEPDYMITHSKADVRKALEECLVCVEAYVEGGNVRAAYCDPDTSQRHCSEERLHARIARVEDRLLELGDADQRYYTTADGQLSIDLEPYRIPEEIRRAYAFLEMNKTLERFSGD